MILFVIFLKAAIFEADFGGDPRGFREPSRTSGADAFEYFESV